VGAVLSLALRRPLERALGLREYAG
jgi:hypothetical protein